MSELEFLECRLCGARTIYADAICGDCEDADLLPMLARAWDEGHRGLCRRHGVAPFAACVNPYWAETGA